MIRCPQCDNENTPDSLFCWSCGTSLASGAKGTGTGTAAPLWSAPTQQPPPAQQSFCENCGSAMAADSTFCGNCGAATKAAAASAPVASPNAGDATRLFDAPPAVPTPPLYVPAESAAALPPPPPPEPPPARSRMKLLIAALAGFLMVLVAAGYYVYANWPRHGQPVSAPPQQQAAATQPGAPPPVVESPQPAPTETQAPAVTGSSEPAVQPPVPTETAPPPPSSVNRSSAPPVQHQRTTTRHATPASVGGAPAPELSRPPSPQQQAAEPAASPTSQEPPPSTSTTSPTPVATAPPTEEPAVQQQPPPPAPVTATAPARRAYSGPQSGWLTWSGKLGKNDTLIINGPTASTGSLTGELPGVPVNVVLDVSNIGLEEEPSPRNNFKRLVLRSMGKHSAIRIHWTVR